MGTGCRGGADVPTEDACKTTLKRDAINQLLPRFVCFSPRLVMMGFATVEAEGYRNPRKKCVLQLRLNEVNMVLFNQEFSTTGNLLKKTCRPENCARLVSLPLSLAKSQKKKLPTPSGSVSKKMFLRHHA